MEQEPIVDNHQQQVTSVAGPALCFTSIIQQRQQTASAQYAHNYLNKINKNSLWFKHKPKTYSFFNFTRKGIRMKANKNFRTSKTIGDSPVHGLMDL